MSFLLSYPYKDSPSFYLTVPARISRIMLNRNGKNGHPCFIPEIRKTTFSLLLSKNVSMSSQGHYRQEGDREISFSILYEGMVKDKLRSFCTITSL
jgi:hypothetical protein